METPDTIERLAKNYDRGLIDEFHAFQHILSYCLDNSSLGNDRHRLFREWYKEVIGEDCRFSESDMESMIRHIENHIVSCK